jgi:hypothetical protein
MQDLPWWERKAQKHENHKVTQYSRERRPTFVFQGKAPVRSAKWDCGQTKPVFHKKKGQDDKKEKPASERKKT